MSSNFPTSLDELSNPTATAKLNSPSHSEQHSNANDAIEALEAKVGANSSIVTTSHDFKLSSVADGQKAVSTSGDQSVYGIKNFKDRAYFSAAIKPPIINLTDDNSGTINIDLHTGNLFRVVINGNRTFTVSNIGLGQPFILIIVQPAAGSKTVTWWSTVWWEDGIAPILTTNANKANIIGFIPYSSGNFYGIEIANNI